MVRRHQAQLSISQLVLFGVVVPDPASLMDPVLRRVDVLLDDEMLVDEVLRALRRRFPQSARRGRRGTPAEVVLRMLALKHLRHWSYAELEREVTGSLVYRRFCRIDGGKVPDEKTMVRLGQLLDAAVLRELFDRVVGLAVEKKVTTGRRMRIDTTVVEANIRYPTDSGLCEDVVRVLRRGLERLAEVGVMLGFKLRSVRRSMSRRMREIAAALRRRDKDARNKALDKPYRGILRITGRLVRQAERASQVAHKQIKRMNDEARAAAAVLLEEIEKIVPRARQVLRQTRARIQKGVTDSKGKLVSIFEPHAQILRRGKLDKPTEYGMMATVQEAEGGIVTDVGLVPGKADQPLLVPAVERHIKVFGHAPGTAATDRGFYSNEGERKIRELGVRRAVIPKPGHRSDKRIEYERQRWFRTGRAWRVGGEARISRLKHCFGMHRSRYRGEVGMARTVFWAAIANNLAAVAARCR
jgi:IS5 family transposase